MNKHDKGQSWQEEAARVAAERKARKNRIKPDAAQALLAACRLFEEWSNNATLDDPPEHPSFADVEQAITEALELADK